MLLSGECVNVQVKATYSGDCQSGRLESVLSASPHTLDMTFSWCTVKIILCLFLSYNSWSASKTLTLKEKGLINTVF